MNWIKISLVIIIAGIIFLSLKQPSEAVTIRINDKLGHLFAYCALTVNAGLLFSKNKWWTVALSAFFLSAFMEYLQGFVPGRMVDWKDLMANATGILIGLIALVLFKEKILELLKRIKLVSE